jgi:hypothetical protein
MENKPECKMKEQISRHKKSQDSSIDGSQVSNSMSPPPFQLTSSDAGQPAQKKAAGTAMPSIVLKRKNIHLFGDDKYGHWWVEINKKRSYGWWPKNQVGLKGTLGGTEGELNGQTNYGGTANKDPHHGDSAEQEIGVECTDPAKTESEVQTDIITFANNYSGEWRWTFGFGQNCHTFQKSMLKATNLVEK